MKITPFGGVKEIGGNTISLESEGARILFDFGRSFGQEGTFFSGYLQPRISQNLKDLLEFDIIPFLPGLYSESFGVEQAGTKAYFKACFLSHAHLDHFGNLNLLHDDTIIYMGETASTIIKSIQDTSRTRFGPYIREASSERPSNVRNFRTNDIIQIEDLEITPIHVDHSLPGSYGFIIEDTKGTTIGYSGDLRLHGWKSKLTEDFIKKAKKMNLRALLMEGTNINEDFQDNENQVQKDLSQTISETESLVIANYSLRDIDRFRSFYLASKENNRKLIISLKQAYLLKLLQDDPHLEIPSLDDPSIVVYKRPKKKYYKWEKELLEELPAIITEPTFDQTEYVFQCDFWNLTDLIDIQPETSSTYVYSHGDPFDDEGQIDYNRMMNWINHFQLKIVQFHASGHAPKLDLKHIVEEISPEIIIPIHTEHPEGYNSLTDIPVLLPVKKKQMVV
ncbi:MAG: MBL fold metallo-hydrolase [Candidatus Hodarchaeales archaeon]